LKRLDKRIAFNHVSDPCPNAHRKTGAL
jgi:hypothetical protein